MFKLQTITCILVFTPVQQRSPPSELQKQNPELWLDILLFLAGRLFDFMPVENINFHGLKIYLK